MLQVSANLIEPGEDVLVLNSGYFGDAFADCLQTYGAKVTTVQAPVGAAVAIPDLEAALKTKKFKAVTVTHVDTSTGKFTATARFLSLNCTQAFSRQLRMWLLPSARSLQRHWYARVFPDTLPGC